MESDNDKTNSKQAELEVKKLSLTLKGIFLALLKNSQTSIWEGRQCRTKVAVGVCLTGPTPQQTLDSIVSVPPRSSE